MKMQLKPASLIFLFIFSVHFSYGQKLPDIQEGNVSVPVNIKADGKNIEWKDTFQALNKRTGLYYTLANDSENLYLAVKSLDAANNNKIMSGGIDFTINTEGKKREKEGLTVTYPLVKNSRGAMRSRTGTRRSEGAVNPQQSSQSQRDSAILTLRKSQLAQAQEIKLYGFKAIPDSLISIYNEYRLRAFASFDENGLFFYELAIPLKLLGLKSGTVNEIAYNIKVNGIQMGSGGRGGSPGFGERSGGRSSGGGFGGGTSDMQSLFSPTDFWGSYKLSPN